MINTRNIASYDLEDLRKWRMDPQVQDSAIERVILTKENQVAWFNNINIDSYYIVEVNNNKIGTFKLDGSCKHDRYVWSFHLNPDYRGKKYQGQAYSLVLCKEALRTAFRKLKANKLIGFVLADNERSIKLHKKLGFVQEGYLKEDIKKDNKYIDLYQFALYKNNYNE